MTSINLIGAGAIGCLYGGKLAQAGTELHVLTKASHIQVKSVWGDFEFKPTQIYSAISEMPKTSDYLLICTKVLPDTSKLIQDVAPLIGKNTTIVLIQNGIDIETPWQKAYPSNELISGLAFVCVMRESPELVRHVDYGRLVLSEKGESLCKLFQKSGVPCQISDNILQARWKKLIWNAPFNTLSVLTQKNTKEILQDPDLRKKVTSIMKEVQLIAKAEGQVIEDEFIEKNIHDTEKMTPYKPSMLLDYEAKRPMETEAILGNALRIAKKHGLVVPEIEALYLDLCSIH